MIKVGVDIQVLQSHERSGYGYYVDGLFTALQKNAPKDFEVIGLKSRWSEGLPTYKRWFHDRFELNWLAERAGVDLIHQPCFSAPKSRKKVVWTLHDLRQNVLHEPMGAIATLYWERWLPYSARYANQVVVTSTNTQKDCERYVGILASKTDVITIGLPQKLLEWKPSKKLAQECRQEFKIRGHYFTTLGSTQPIKNYPFLIDFFQALRKKQGLPHQLVIIGSKSWDFANVEAKCREHNLVLGEDVIVTGFVTDEQKWQLIADSQAFFFPSKYEGFGIPPIEAQALGVPVLASNNSSLPWVVGDGGVIANTNDISAWCEGYEELIKNRETYVTRGLTNIKRFDWDAIANEWFKLYRSLV